MVEFGLLAVLQSDETLTKIPINFTNHADANQKFLFEIYIGKFFGLMIKLNLKISTLGKFEHLNFEF